MSFDLEIELDPVPVDPNEIRRHSYELFKQKNMKKHYFF
jgi:hypothetical protein